MLRTKTHTNDRECAMALMLIVCLVVLMFPAGSVKAQNGPFVTPVTSSDFCPIVPGGVSHPYVAGYMAFDYIQYGPMWDAASALCVTVSFAGTNKSVIQTDNALAAGIATQGPHHVRDEHGAYIDWGYTLLLVLNGSEADPYIEGVVWKGYEWGRNGQYWWNPFDPPVYELTWGRIWKYSSALVANSTVTLWMIWNSTHLNYYATIEGVHYDLFSYIPEVEELHYFMLGTCNRGIGPIPLGGTCKFFQFSGAWSVYPIGSGGWRSHLSQPCFIKSGETWWRTVDFAYTVQGDWAFWDNTMRWGGACYPSIGARYFYDGSEWPLRVPFGHVIFYPTIDGSTIPSDTLLWDPQSLGEGGCPYVYTWNGQRYLVDNNLLPASETSCGFDVNDYYRLEKLLVPRYKGEYESLYSLEIREFEHEHDYLDQVKLLAVDHGSDVNVAVTPSGEILGYSTPAPPVTAIDETGADVLSQLNSIDGNYYQGRNGSHITVAFAQTDISNGVKLVIRSDQEPIMKSPVYIQVLNATGEWGTIATFHTRTYWATDIINMTNYLPDAEGKVQVRFYFISNDKIDYIGLDTSPQANMQVRQATLLSAYHSAQGDVTALFTRNDQTYAELIPNTTIQLIFLLPNSQKQERTFILYTEGHYDRIT